MVVKQKTSTETLLKMKETIEADKVEANKLEGQLEEQMKHLHSLGYKNVAQAEAALTTINAEVKKLEQQVTDGIARLQEDFGL